MNMKYDIDLIKKIPIEEVASDLGFTVKRIGNSFQLKEYDSLMINPHNNTFKRFSTDFEKGDVIQFIQTYSNMTDFKDAIKYLNDKYLYNQQVKAKLKTNFSNKEKHNNGKLMLPKFNDDFKRVYAYLIKTRGIPKEIVGKVVKEGLLKQDERGNCVFLGKDSEGKVKFACLSSTNGKKFKLDLPNSSKDHSFSIKNSMSNIVVVCESPIDVLSAMSIYENVLSKNLNYISLGGVSSNALDTFLVENKINKIVLALDNDEAGRSGSKNIIDKYKDKYQITNMNKLFKEYKDINEYVVDKGMAKIKQDLMKINEKNQKNAKIVENNIKSEKIDDKSNEIDKKHVEIYENKGDVEVNFLDYNLEDKIKYLLSNFDEERWNIRLINENVSYENIDKITKSAMENISYLDLSNSDIKNIEGIENARNLVNLSLKNNPLESIDPIYQLESLIDLNIKGTGIFDKSEILENTNISYIDIDEVKHELER